MSCKQIRRESIEVEGDAAKTLEQEQFGGSWYRTNLSVTTDGKWRP
jgi:hypothetical protein